MKRPIHIIGGGLAGLSLGIALRNRGVETQLTEAGSYPRHRVCGEFISGISDGALEDLGIDDLFKTTCRHRTSGWYYGEKMVFSSDLPKPAYGVSRYRLDHQLANRFTELGGTLHTQTRYQGNEDQGFVYAQGRPRTKESQWIGLKCHLLNYDHSHDLEMHLGEGVYMGFSEVEDGRTDACGLFKLRTDVKAPRLKLLTTYLAACGLNDLAEKVTDSEMDESSCLGVNAFEFGYQPSKTEADTRLRIGDQFAITGPFSGNGMSMAFEGAATAIEPLINYTKGDLSWEESRILVSQRLTKQFQRRLSISKFLQPFLTDPTKQKCLIQLGKMNLIPFGTLFRLSR